MTNRDHVSTLRMCSDLQAFIGTRLQQIYDAAPSRDYLFTDELSKAIVNADKMTLIIRVLEQIAERGTPVKFCEQEREVMDQLLRSAELIQQRVDAGKVLDFKRSAVDRVGYLGIQGEDSAS